MVSYTLKPHSSGTRVSGRSIFSHVLITRLLAIPSRFIFVAVILSFIGLMWVVGGVIGCGLIVPWWCI